MPSRSGQRPADDAPPEAWLIWQARNARIPVPSRRQCARLAGISPQTWSNVERGEKAMGAGVRMQWRGEAATVAQMAAVAGVTAEQLRGAGRGDAADILDLLLRAKPSQLHRDLISEAVEVVDRSGLNQRQRERLRAAIAEVMDDPPAADGAGLPRELSRDG